MNQLRHFVSAFIAIVTTAALLGAAPASATTILTFGQSAGGSPITGTNNGAGSTTITGTNVAISITQIDALLGTPIAAFLNFTATSSGAATTIAGNVVQVFTGTFTITSLAGGGGVNYLSSAGTFIDSVFGSGASLTLSVAQPPDTVAFSSDVIADLGLARGLSFSFANVTPPVGIHNGSLGSFTSSVSGTFSANVGQQVPEPGSLVLVGLAMLGLVGFLRRKSLR